MNDFLWDARGNQTRRHLLFGTDQDRLLQDRLRNRGKAIGQRHRHDTGSPRFQQGRLMVETTDKISLDGGNLGSRFDLEIP